MQKVRRGGGGGRQVRGQGGGEGMRGGREGKGTVLLVAAAAAGTHFEILSSRAQQTLLLAMWAQEGGDMCGRGVGGVRR